MTTYDVFLSHASADKPSVEILARRLREDGLEPFLDKWHLIPGKPWQEGLEDALEASRTCAVFVGQKLGPWQNEEMRAALDERARDPVFRVIPVLLPGALKPDRKDLPRFLRRLTWVDFRNGLDDEVAYHRLVCGIRGVAPDAGSAPASADFRAYLKALVDRTDHINISGISGAGRVKGALRHPIERLYTPLQSRDLRRADGPAALEGRNIRLPDLLPRHPRLLIEGQPGAGKTTFARLVACMLARDVLGLPCPDGSSWRRAHLGLADDTPPALPVLVRIGDLVPLLARAPALRHDDRRGLLDLLESLCQENDFNVARRDWEERLTAGGALLFLDGLDEVADETLRARLFEVFRDACRHWTCPIVVTSRPIQTAALGEMGFHVATIEPFGDREIRLFIDHWVSALHGAESVDQLGGEGERYRADLAEAIVKKPRVRRMATNPVMLTCLCVVHWNEGRLPEGRSRVYAAVVRWLIAARKELREEQGFTDYLARRALARLALAMMTADGGKRSVFDLEEGAVAVDAAIHREFPDLDPEERRLKAREWLRFECLGSGIVEELAGSRARFWHLTFQEYLAALQLAWRGDGEDPEADWWPVVENRLDDAQWRETVELFPGCLLDEGGEGRVDKLLDRVLSLRGDEPDLATEARTAGIVGRLLEPLTVYQYRPRPAVGAAYREALERSMAVFTVEGAARVPIKDRIAAAEALGRGGDPRLRKDHLLEVPGTGGFRLAKYPVTVEEYQRFVEHQGYELERYWDEAGWKLRSEEEWTCPSDWDVQLATPNRPVVDVSWYEACAYCRWLSEQRSTDLRLPPEAVWEKAATPDRGEYPWGEEPPDAERANFAPDWDYPNVGAPTPVGVYPSGDGPYGHCDLAGNVWEWCAEGFEGPEDEDKVLRGGCWFNPAVHLRAAYRHRFGTRFRVNDVGFRVCAAPLDS